MLQEIGAFPPPALFKISPLGLGVDSSENTVVLLPTLGGGKYWRGGYRCLPLGEGSDEDVSPQSRRKEDAEKQMGTTECPPLVYS